MDMENEFLQSVNLDLLQKELDLDIQGISSLVKVSSQTIYKWNRAKDKGGCRPTFDTMYILFKNGATLKSLFGLDYPAEKPKPLNQEDFLAGVKQALAALASGNPGNQQ